MQITVTRTGGFAGVHQQLGPVETSSLDPEVADQIDRILSELDFFNLPESLPAAHNISDGFFYAVQVVADDRDHTVRTEDGSDDPAAIELRQLISLLDGAAGRFEDRPMDSDADSVPTRDWSAWYNRMPGPDPDPDLHVSGICSLESSNITVQLEPDNEGIIDDPELFVLKLVVTKPAIHDDRYVEREVTWQKNVGPGIKRVRINAVTDEIPVIDAR
jgi:hypothetical protein